MIISSSILDVLTIYLVIPPSDAAQHLCFTFYDLRVLRKDTTGILDYSRLQELLNLVSTSPRDYIRESWLTTGLIDDMKGLRFSEMANTWQILRSLFDRAVISAVDQPKSQAMVRLCFEPWAEVCTTSILAFILASCNMARCVPTRILRPRGKDRRIAPCRVMIATHQRTRMVRFRLHLWSSGDL